MAVPALTNVGTGSSMDSVARLASSSASKSDPLEPFANVLKSYLGEANALSTTANQAVLDLATGKTDDVHSVLLASAKADIAFRMMLQVRNRLTDAYQEITRMPV
jgi:flagellar hook-basal body complex protein FliE